MTKYFAIAVLLHLIINPGIAQTKLNVGVAYFGEALSNPGIMLEFEREHFFGESFSLPSQADLGFFDTPDYRVLFLDVHNGFRKYFQSGLFVEQSVGLGVMATYYDVESIFYLDKYGNAIRYNEGANYSIKPSVSMGLGYHLAKNKTTQNLIWIRPKVYWQLGFRGLHLPYAAVQIGFSHQIK